MTGPTLDFWQQRFLANQTPWDRGAANPQLAAWIDAGVLAPCRILVPGCGGGHEVAVLAQAGFAVTALDYAPAAIALTRERLARARVRATLVQADSPDRRRGVRTPSRRRPVADEIWARWQARWLQGSICGPTARYQCLRRIRLQGGA